MVELAIGLIGVVIGVLGDQIRMRYQQHKQDSLKDEKKRAASLKTAAKRREKALNAVAKADPIAYLTAAQKAAQKAARDVAYSGPGPADQTDPTYYGKTP